MSDLKWIPVQDYLTLPPGTYWRLWDDGVATAGKWTRGGKPNVRVTHYCPIPEPVMPEPEPQPQDCVFCEFPTCVKRGTNGGGGYRVECTGCPYRAPWMTSVAEAVTLHNRIRLAPEGGES